MKQTNFDFMGKRKIAAGISAFILIFSLFEIFYNGLTLGLDFTGGTLIELGFEQEVDADQLRNNLVANGFENGTVQYFGSNQEVLIRMPPQGGIEQATLGDRIFASVQAQHEGVSLRQSNFVGPAVGEELAEDGGLALLAALIVVMLYILFRFTKQFAIGAVAALAHDVFAVLGIFAIFHLTFDLTVLAALLAVIGYSLNDTIVVSDRIRENFRKIRKRTPIEVINESLNQTLGRTLVTSLTTLFVLLALLFAGGEAIRGFALALSIGVLVGTYSSIYVSANILLALNITREDLLVPEPEKEDNPEGSYP
jgi:preprotein translocase subunit SecF